MQEKKTDRQLAYDILRIIGAFSVVLLHSAAQLWYAFPVDSMDWKIANGFDAVSRMGVPLFVMISGALFLGCDKAPDRKRLWKHNILRLVVVYFLWCGLYGIYTCWKWGYESYSLIQIVKALLSGSYHLWYLPMIIGIYMLSPILYELVHKIEKQLLEYFLILFVVFQILRTTGMALTTSGFFINQLDHWEISMVCSYIGYFILGYYLATYGVSDKISRILKIGILPAAVFNVAFSTWQSVRLGEARGEIYDSFCIGTFWISVALFVWVKEKAGTGEKTRTGGILAELSKDTLGVYLMHVGILETLFIKEIGTNIMPVWLTIPVLALAVFGMSAVLSALLRRIPGLGRYIC